MYSTLVSVLLLGIGPNIAATGATGPTIEQIDIAPPAAEVRIAERLSASGVLILDRQGAQIAYAKQADVSRPMASITKLMTALVIVENHDLDEVLQIPGYAENVIGNRAHLPAGEWFTVGDLLSALLISSGNDAAIVLAQYHSGSVGDFVMQMNKRATELGLHQTSFANPSGLDDSRQFSTPRNIALLASHALKYPAIRERMETRGTRIYSSSGHEIVLTHTHQLLHQVSPVTAGKTGTTDDAGQCLVSLVEQDGREFLVVILHSDKRYSDMQIILEAMGTPLNL